MSNINICPCCSDSMLRHLSNRHSYWFCSRCRIEMPDITHKQKAHKKIKMNLNSSAIDAVAIAQKNAASVVAL